MKASNRTKGNTQGEDSVPAQHVGTEMNAVEQITFNSEKEAIAFFKIVKKRLLDVNCWAEIASTKMSHFYLTDAKGNLLKRRALEGDFIKIDIPGPGTHTGGGYDWVQIEEIKDEVLEDAEILSMRVRPAGNPSKEEQSTAHFLTKKATSTFQVKRFGDTVFAEEHGRNELANTETEHTLDNIRNMLVGWGAKMGFSYPQWKALVKGLLDKKT